MTYNEIKKIHTTQLNEMDCGSACLSMFVKFVYGEVSVQEVRERTGLSAKGLTIHDMITAAQSFRIELTGLKGSVEELLKEAAPFILIERNASSLHYIVAWKWTSEKVWISDPAEGSPKKMGIAEMADSWTGYGLRLETKPEKKRVKLKTPWTAWLQFERPLLVLIGFMTVLLSFLSLAGAFFSKWLLDVALPQQVSIYQPAILFSTLLLLGILLGMAREFGLIAHFVRFNMLHLNQQFEQVWRMPTLQFNRYTTGDLIARLQDFRKVQSILTELISRVGIQLAMVLMISAILIILHPPLWIAVCLPIPWFFIVVKPRSFQLNDKQSRVLSTRSKLETQYWQWVSHRSFWRTFLDHNVITQKHDLLLKDWIHKRKKLGEELIGLHFSFEFISLVGYAVVIYLTASAYRHNELSLGALITCISLWGMLGPAWRSSISWYPKWIEAKWVWKRVAQWNFPDQPKSVSLSNRIKLSQQIFQWPDQRRLIFKEAKVELGEIVLLSGSSGSGKSTLLQLLIGDLPWNQGDSWPYSAWFPQEVPLITGTLADNLFVGYPGSESWDRAIRRWDDWGLVDWVQELPLAWSTPIGEGARALSGGQKQLVAWMRIIASDAKIWLLDEATAHLDEHWAQHLLNKLWETRWSRGVLLITHRKSDLTFDPSRLWKITVDGGSHIVERAI